MVTVTRIFSTSVVGTLAALMAVANAAASSRPNLYAYIVDWEIPKDIQWSKVDHVIYAFAEPDQQGKLTNFDSQQLQSVVKQAHANNVGISLSVGGWTGSRYFSDILEKSSSSFANTLLDAVKQYSLDGLNIDWEYPNSDNGMSCNSKNAKDTENYLAFLTTLRKGLGNKLITLASSTTPFNDASGNPSKNLAPLAKVVDSFLVMTYDINGNWDATTGPNSPLYDGPKGERMSVDAALTQWHAAGVPYQQLSVGAAFYGWTARTTSNNLSSQYVSFAKVQIQGDQYDTMSADPCPGSAKSYSGEIQWRSIASEGIDANKNSWKTSFDSTTETPYSISSRKRQIVTYDNAKSLAKKAQYAKQHGATVFLWSLEMDDAQHTLLNSLQSVRA
ncbi:hypothetical protein Unana1_04566 [Umbelopsis nana]